MSPASPRLALIAASDSFATLWPALAAEGGFELVTGDAPPEDAALVVLNAAGVEERIGGRLEALRDSAVDVCVVGALADYRVAVAAVRAGAREYFALPQGLELLKGWLEQHAARFRAAGVSASFAAREASKYQFEGILGESTALRETLERAARIIPHGGVTVLIGGETGTGKELLARAIHYNGPRRKAPFVDVNCAAIPEQLLESELFGHEKGAFTDASAAKPGLFEVARGGTIFLDEIGHLSLPLQGKLLRVLEQREFRRVGGTATLTMDVRVIAATHVDLAEASRRGEFREDLYYRLNVVGLRLPALRERGDDLLLLTRKFLERFAQEYGVPAPELTAPAERRIRSHPWNGNIRELRNVLERALLLSSHGRLEAADLGLDAARPLASADGVPFPATMSEITRAAAHAMIRLCDGNKSEAARRLSISRTRLLRLIAPRGRQAALMEEEF
ncbi:MAG: sigma 54-interacting transcriptional regulator [Gemmatimonadetes bacterium]|nr:sigma 54-interacting transcriptional regulator [Gemmatimonadota bacterium]